MRDEGSCVLTYHWGDLFKKHKISGSVIAGKLGIARTPGSNKVLDRKTMKLVPCNADRCKYGKYIKDLKEIINFSPYAAFGGWACAVSNYTTVQKKLLATQFCEYASSKAISLESVIPLNATGKYRCILNFKTIEHRTFSFIFRRIQYEWLRSISSLTFEC